MSLLGRPNSCGTLFHLFVTQSVSKFNSGLVRNLHYSSFSPGNTVKLMQFRNMTGDSG